MKTMKFAAAMLACLSAAMAFNCPDDAHPFYHADVSTGCQVYHHCQNSELQTFTCPSGQAFNHVTSQCEDASNVDCIETMPEHSHHHHEHHHLHKRSVGSDFNCPEDAQIFYHADVYTGCQVYHICHNSQMRTLACPQGEAFNHVTLQCEDASTVDCVETMEEYSHHHHHKRSVDLAFNCPEDSHTFYHADISSGCQVYHLCQNSELQTLTCPSGQAFNHATLQCEDASTVDCFETMGEHSHHHHQIHNHHKRSVASSFNCPEDAHNFYHADVSTGCQVYHHCQNSELQTLTCSSGQAFNHVTLQCEDASTVECIETMPEHSHHHHQHHHHHKRSVASDFNCPEDAHIFYHADISTGCQVYHVCQNSQMQTLSCPSRQAFNHVTLQCEDASTVECIETMGEHSHHHHEHALHKRSAALDFNCPDDAHTFYHADVSTGCQVYHVCQNSHMQTLSCPSGQAFNHVTLQCEDASTVECIETMGEHSHHHHEHELHKRSAALDFNCPDDAHTFYHADVSTGCQVYHVCQNSQMQTLSCPSGQAFNHVTLQCEDGSTVECIETMGEHSHHHHEHVLHKRSAALDFNCPDDAHTFYHADVSSGCQVYHLCQNSQLQTFTCPSGQAFNHVTLQCEDASTVNCIETMSEHSHHHHQTHHHHKRSAEDTVLEDHEQSEPNNETITPEMKAELVHKFNELFRKLCKHNKCGPNFEIGSYLRVLYNSDSTTGQKLKKGKISKEDEQVRNKRETGDADIDHEPSEPNKITVPVVTEENNLTNIQKGRSFLGYIIQAFTEVFTKNCKHDKCDNNFDFEPLLREWINVGYDLPRNLGKTKVSKEEEQVRNKRDTHDARIDSVSDAMMYLTEKYATDSLYGNGTSFLFKIVLPVFYEMMENEQTRMDVLSVVISAKNVFKPVALQILKNQNSADKFINIPRRVYDNSVKEFLKENRIVIEKVIERHLKAFGTAAQESIPFFVESYERLKAGKYPQADTLKKAAVYFYQKHGKLLQSSSSATMKFYPVKEILEDLIPIKNALRQIFMDYFNLSEDSWLSFIFGDVHATENVSPKYTKPIPKLYSKKSAY